MDSSQPSISRSELTALSNDALADLKNLVETLLNERERYATRLQVLTSKFTSDMAVRQLAEDREGADTLRMKYALKVLDLWRFYEYAWGSPDVGPKEVQAAHATLGHLVTSNDGC